MPRISWSLIAVHRCRLILSGLLAALTVILIISITLHLWENVVFQRLVKEVRDSLPPEATRTDLALALMSRVNGTLHLAGERGEAAAPAAPGSLHSSLEQLYHPIGACTSYTQVLAKALIEAGYDARKVGLEKDGKRAIHHVLEAKIGDSWVLMDPSYNLAFHRQDGRLANVVEVSGNWGWYRQQVPPDYNVNYDYSAYYYTNWDRLPMVGTFVRSHPDFRAWLRANRVSVRFWFIDLYRWTALLTVLAMLPLFIVRRRCSRRLHSSASAAI